MARVKIAEFGIIQKELALATVTVYNADGNGKSTGTKATLYSASSGATQLENPQSLDVDGKLSVDVYIEATVMATITNISPKIERYIKKIRQSPTQFALPITSSNFSSVNALGSVAICEASAISASDDADQTALDRIQTGLDRIATSTNATASGISETNAAGSAVAALASETAVANALDNLWLSGEKHITFADSPYTLIVGDNGSFVSVDTSGGNVVIVQDQISILGGDFKCRIKKDTSDGNSLQLNCSGTDTFHDGSTSKTISAVGGMDISANATASPDHWDTASFGASAGQMTLDTFVVGTDVSIGDANITLSGIAGSAQNVQLFYDGAPQFGFTLSGAVLAFASVLPSYVTEVRALFGSTTVVGTTGDGTVSFTKMASSAIATEADAIAGLLANKLMTALQTKQAIEATSPFSSRFQSAEKTISNAAFVSDPHLLGSTPKMSHTVLICKITDLGYPVGAQVSISAGGASGNQGVTTYVDATTIGAQVGSNGVRIARRDGALGDLDLIDLAKWKIIMSALA